MQIPIYETFLLLVVFQVKHFLCDYPLQGQYMLGKFKGGSDWVLPLASHAGVHGLFTFGIAACMVPIRIAVMIAIVDYAVHFLQDRLKASPNLLGRWKPDNKFFWWALGQDQMAHHLTHYAIVAYLVTFTL